MNNEGRIAMLVIRVPKNVRRVRIFFVRTFFIQVELILIVIPIQILAGLVP